MKYSNTFAQINLNNLSFNYRKLVEISGGKTVICIVKADAYGHGAAICARRLQEDGAEYFAVASIDEAEELRKNGIEKPILILGYIPLERVSEVIEYALCPGIYSMGFAYELNREAVRQNKKVDVHIKLNTGMNRLGFSGRENSVAHIKEINSLDGINIKGIFSHYCTADEDDLSYSRLQLEKFKEILADIRAAGIDPPIVHISNSAATLAFDCDIANAVRPGLALYGINPLISGEERCELRPVMTFCSQVANTFTLHAGESIGYGRKYTADSNRKIAVVCAGYADGYFRLLSNKADVSINGKRAKIRGNICMDMLMADITDIPDVKVGDKVELFGSNIPASELADMIGTIPYEITCALSKRVQMVITEE